ncbi:unnamed protein product, partial [marine sediment metagenome]
KDAYVYRSKYLCEECYADSSMQSDIEEKGWDNGPLKPAAASERPGTVGEIPTAGSNPAEQQERGQPEGVS